MFKQISLSVLGIIGVLLFIMMLGFGSDWIGLQWNKFIAPQKEEVRREVFEQTKSFNQGMTMKLLDYRKQYMMAKSEDDKAAIAGVVAHMFADYSPDNLDPELKSFLRECKYNQ